MDFEVPDKINVITGMIDEFVDKEILPLESEFLRKTFREMLPVIEQKRSMVKKMELWAPNHPKEYGGMGLDLVEYAFVSESLGRTPLGHFVFGCQAPDAGNIEILYLHGTPEQKETYLRPLVSGKIRSCFSMTEVEMPGSNPVMMETTAVRDGEDYVINGQKWYSTAADGAAFSIVMALTNPDAQPYLRASMIIVPTDTLGSIWSETFRSWGTLAMTMRPTARCCSSHAGFPGKTCWDQRDPALSSPRSASGRAGSTTA
jgi:acyl-CoA dehydrogenase